LLAAGKDNSPRDFATIGDQDFFEAASHIKIVTSEWQVASLNKTAEVSLLKG
jgi:hypothetical protein